MKIRIVVRARTEPGSKLDQELNPGVKIREFFEIDEVSKSQQMFPTLDSAKKENEEIEMAI